MTPVDYFSVEKPSLEDYINTDDVRQIMDRGAIVGIYPERGRLEMVCIITSQIGY